MLTGLRSSLLWLGNAPTTRADYTTAPKVQPNQHVYDEPTCPQCGLVGHLRTTHGSCLKNPKRVLEEMRCAEP